jgi:hypothetical protein
VDGKTIRIFLAAEILVAGAGLKRRASVMTWSLGERDVGG